MKRGFAFALGLSMGLPVYSVAAQENDGSYYCVAEFSGGVAYDEPLKKWTGAVFRPSEKFIVRFKYAGPHQEDTGGPSYYDDYFVTVTRSGTDKAEACKTHYGKTTDRISFTRGDVVRGDCQTILMRYTFSLNNKRFLRYFEAADYVLGSDTKDTDTPSISGGACTKIQ